MTDAQGNTICLKEKPLDANKVFTFVIEEKDECYIYSEYCVH